MTSSNYIIKKNILAKLNNSIVVIILSLGTFNYVTNAYYDNHL
jgi:hypothetical protein